MQIDVQGLSKTYVTYERGSSLWQVIASVVRRRPVDICALRAISFSIGEGELVGFLGPNGAGKSTTLKILSGVLHPSAGKATVMGYVPWKQRQAYVANIGAVFGQKSQLIWDIPPIDAFNLNQAIYDIKKSDFDATLKTLSTMLDVTSIMHKPTRTLSLGERMRCELIIAMLHRPRVVFLDEPTIGLDVIAKEAIHTFIKQMNREGVTFILTTHDLDDVERLARRVIVINHGELVFDEALTTLRRYFGQRKMVRLVSERPLDTLSLDGLELSQRKGATDADYELDLSKLSLATFMSAVQAQVGVRDIAIEEVPIERVIKELYARRA